MFFHDASLPSHLQFANGFFWLHLSRARRLEFILSLIVGDFMMLQLLRLFSGVILQVTISFVVLCCVPFARHMETLINININLNVGRTEVKEKRFV
jgi:hypothetical protein